MKNWNDFNFIKKTRKEKDCATCCRTIEAGESRYNYIGNYDGDFQNWNVCPTCYEVFDEIYNDRDYISGCELVDFIIESLWGWQCPICGEERDNLDIDTKNNKFTITCHNGHESEKELIAYIKNCK